MKHILAPFVVIGLIGMVGPSLADDVLTSAGKAQQQKVMEECMAKQAASNTEMSKTERQKRCQEEMRAQKDNDDRTDAGASSK